MRGDRRKAEKEATNSSGKEVEKGDVIVMSGFNKETNF